MLGLYSLGTRTLGSDGSQHFVQAAQASGAQSSSVARSNAIIRTDTTQPAGSRLNRVNPVSRQGTASQSTSLAKPTTKIAQGTGSQSTSVVRADAIIRTDTTNPVAARTSKTQPIARQGTASQASSLAKPVTKIAQGSASQSTSTLRADALVRTDTTNPVATRLNQVQPASRQGTASQTTSFSRPVVKIAQATGSQSSSLLRANALIRTDTTNPSASRLNLTQPASTRGTASQVSSLLRSIGHLARGSSSPVASRGVMTIGKVLTDTSSLVASLVRQAGKLLTDSASSPASIVHLWTRPLALQSSISATASRQLQVNLVRTDTAAAPASSRHAISPATRQSAPSSPASLLRKTGKPLSDTTNPVANLAEAKAFLRSLTDTTSPAAAAIRALGLTTRQSTSATATSASRQGQPNQMLGISGTVTSYNAAISTNIAGALARTVASTLTPFVRGLFGSTSPVGSMSTMKGKNNPATAATATSFAKLPSKALRATGAQATSQQSAITTARQLTITQVASRENSASRSLQATSSTSGSFAKLADKVLQAMGAQNSTLIRQIGALRQDAIATPGTLALSTLKALVSIQPAVASLVGIRNLIRQASASVSGATTRVIAKAFASTISSPASRSSSTSRTLTDFAAAFGTLVRTRSSPSQATASQSASLSKSAAPSGLQSNITTPTSFVRIALKPLVSILSTPASLIKSGSPKTISVTAPAASRVLQPGKPLQSNISAPATANNAISAARPAATSPIGSSQRSVILHALQNSVTVTASGVRQWIKISASSIISIASGMLARAVVRQASASASATIGRFIAKTEQGSASQSTSFLQDFGHLIQSITSPISSILALRQTIPRPSPGRVVVMRPAFYANAIPLRWDSAAPGDVDWFYLDLSQWAPSGDRISTPTVSVAPISGDPTALGNDYAFTFSWRDADGATASCIVMLRVEDL